MASATTATSCAPFPLADSFGGDWAWWEEASRAPWDEWWQRYDRRQRLPLASSIVTSKCNDDGNDNGDDDGHDADGHGQQQRMAAAARSTDDLVSELLRLHGNRNPSSSSSSSSSSSDVSNDERSSESTTPLYAQYRSPHHRQLGGAGPPPYVRVVAPMVRYSKMPFRVLCRYWGADIAYTPMIIARAFNRSATARNIEFCTNPLDQPLIAQFGTNDASDMAQAAEWCTGFAQAVDLNCGCPQRWAIKEGIGASLIQQPELVADMVRQVRARTTMPMSIKIRIQDDRRRTVDLVRQAEAAGVHFITVHGRTVSERSTPVHLDAIALVKSIARVPIIANGDCSSPSAVEHVVAETKIDGVMSARGVLANPALFAGYDVVPLECITDYVSLALAYGGRYSLHHHHLMYMLHAHVARAERREFMQLKSMAGVIDFFERRGWWPPERSSSSCGSSSGGSNDVNERSERQA